MTGPDLALLALHGLRLTGLAEAQAVAEVWGADAGTIEVELKSLADDDLVVRRDGTYRSGWLLTAAGRDRAAALVADELDRAGARPALGAAYRRFTGLNPVLLDLCCRWQLRDLDARVRNDHADTAYDTTVIDGLSHLHRRSAPLTADLAVLLSRFGRYGPRLAHALGRVLAGDTDHFTRPVVPSYHTVWFELHEDLLTTLGLDRASETARLARSSIGT